MTKSLTIARPDDWHVHLRDGAMLEAVTPFTAAHFGRALIMPNLVPPVASLSEAQSYRARILAALPAGADFEPLMTLYLTEATNPAMIREAAAASWLQAVKLYPAGATTNSASGVRDLERVLPALETMAEVGLPLCVHGEVTDSDIDIFDREKVFIDRVLDPLRRRLPKLKVVMEHVTTKDGVDYVLASKSGLAASLTVHHLILNRNHLLVGGIRPHYYCLPIVKRERHRQALRQAATSGDPRFFLGTDTAPHPSHAKESACGCAGCFTAPNALACLAHVFEEEQALASLEAFTSRNGAAFYGKAVNEAKLTLTKAEAPLNLPETIASSEGTVHLFDPGFPLYWRVET